MGDLTQTQDLNSVRVQSLKDKSMTDKRKFISRIKERDKARIKADFKVQIMINHQLKIKIT
jgi:hypothetical protein